MFSKGFTLLEVIIAVFILIVGIVAVSLVFANIVSAFPVVSGRLIAAYLVQEGVEIVRNIRDTNWLEGEENSWDEGLTGCSAGCIADYNHPNQLDPILPVYSDQVLNIDTDGFYSYSSGNSTEYKRKITIQQIDNDTLKVFVAVNWMIKGKLYEIKAEEYLYNWR